MRELTAGALLPWEAVRLLRRERGLWGLAAVPLLLSTATLVAAAALVVVEAGRILGWIASALPAVDPTFSWSLLWLGPLWLLGKFALGALFALAVALAFVVALVLASVVASPFHERLSRRVEELVSQRVSETSTDGLVPALRTAVRAIRDELARTGFFLALQAGIVLVGLAAAPLAALVPLALTAVTIVFLPLDHAGFVLDRRGVRFAERRRWVARRAPLMLGFGATSFAICLVPGLNVLTMPVFVVAGTLLALRHGPGASSRVDSELRSEELPDRLQRDPG